MPLSEKELEEVRRRLTAMFDDTVETFELLSTYAKVLFEERGDLVGEAISECLEDFVRNPEASGEPSPRARIARATAEELQNAGFYGAQLDLKEEQVSESNQMFRDSLLSPARLSIWAVLRPFKRWISRSNNFLGSLSEATKLGHALKELKDCLEGELPDEDERADRDDNPEDLG